MAIKRRIESSFVLFDVLYVDGTRSSNRRVASTALMGIDGDEPAIAIIEQQDREIGAASGRPRPAVKSIARAAIRPSVKV
jgi:hypothetical protein